MIDDAWSWKWCCHEQPVQSFKCQHCNLFHSWVMSSWTWWISASVGFGWFFWCGFVGFFFLGGELGFVFFFESVMGQMRHRQQIYLEWSKVWHFGRFWGNLSGHALSLQLLNEQDLGPNQPCCVEKPHLGLSYGPEKLAPLQSLLVLWLRQAEELQGTAGICATAVGCAGFPCQPAVLTLRDGGD